LLVFACGVDHDPSIKNRLECPSALFVWNGKRRLRRQRARDTQPHPLGGSGAVTPRPIDRLNQWQRSCQLIHYQFLIDERIISERSKTYVLIEP
jgi:hypothetical protein